MQNNEVFMEKSEKSKIKINQKLFLTKIKNKNKK